MSSEHEQASDEEALKAMCRSFAFVVTLAVLMTGCSSAPRVVDRATNTAYSEYFENDSTVLDGRLRLHTLMTLGNERVPKDHVWSEPARERLRRNSDVEPMVTEVYATNLGEEPLEITFVAIGARNATRKFPENSVVIQPGEFAKSPPLVNTMSIYKPLVTSHFLEVQVDGARVIVEGEVRRLTINELEQRENEKGVEPR